MNKVFVRLYAFFCSVILIATLGIFIYKLVKSSKEDLIIAQKNFKYIAHFISEKSETEDISSKEFLLKLKELCALSGNIEKAMLVNANNETFFSWDSKTNSITNKPYTFQTNSLILKPYSMSISVKEPNKNETKLFNFSAILKTLSDDLIYTGIRDCFFVFVVLFLFTLMLLIISYLLNGTEKSFKVQVTNEDQTEKNPEVKLNLQDEKKSYTLDDLSNVNFTTEKDFSNTKNLNYANMSDKESTFRSGNNDDIKTVEQKHSDNLKISLEGDLTERLEFELTRATSSEQDLGLIFFILKDVDQKALTKISNFLLRRFKFREMIFKFTETGFAVILYDANLEKSMQEAENAYVDILQIVTKEKIGIGITTRSARLVSAKRLIDEASTAVGKSFKSTTSAIVAFRPDPQAYREYIKDYT